MPVAGLTAWQALFDQGGLRSGQTVLVHGAAGGVGHFAVQFARRAEARVIATASASAAEFVSGLGAEQVIDYRSEFFEQRTGDVDLVLDGAGGETRRRSWQILKPGGMLVSIVAAPGEVEREAAEHDRRGTRAHRGYVPARRSAGGARSGGAARQAGQTRAAGRIKLTSATNPHSKLDRNSG